MPASVAAVKQYIEGSKYKRAKALSDAYEQYKEYLQDLG